MLRVAVVEDEAEYAQLIRDYVIRFGSESGEQVDVTLFGNGMDIAEEYHPVWDIIFLDVEMPLLDGLSAAERIRQSDPAVILIFITKMAQYAIHGYDVDAMDYVLKPLSYYAFAMKMKKAVSVLHSREQTSILLPSEQGFVKVPTSYIYYVEVQAHYIHYHTMLGEFVRKGSLKEVKQQLPQQVFVPCNSCYLVNLRYVTGIHNNMAVVADQELAISRPKRKEFLQRLTDYVGGGGTPSCAGLRPGAE
ncbi:MAG: LytR/AlgR family response regulator transcription factor [Candidatus Onthomonas sp.]